MTQSHQKPEDPSEYIVSSASSGNQLLLQIFDPHLDVEGWGER